MKETKEFYVKVEMLQAERLEELSIKSGRPLSKTFASLFEGHLDMLVKAYEEYDASGAYKDLPKAPGLVFPEAIVIQGVQHPFPNELRTYYARLWPYRKKKLLHFRLPVETVERIQEIATRTMQEVPTVVADFIEFRYYQRVFKPQKDAEKQRKEAEETLAMASDESYWKAPKKK